MGKIALPIAMCAVFLVATSFVAFEAIKLWCVIEIVKALLSL